MVDYGRIPFSRLTAGVGTLQRAPLYTPAILGMARLSACLEEACSPDCPTLVDIGQQEMEWAVSQPDSLSHGAPRVFANAFRMLLA